MKVSITGASGLIGQALSESLRSDGHEVTAVRREGNQFVTDDLAGAEAVVHLAGESIGGKLRWDEEHKRRVLRSRELGTSQVAEFLAGRSEPPRVFASASAVGFYGNNRGDKVLAEDAGPGDGFLSRVCQTWEEVTGPAKEAGIRVAHLRTGIVLSPKGGLLPKLLTPGKFGLGAVLGSGRQWISWISLHDEVRAIRFVLDEVAISGPVNLAAPNPATNAELTKTIGRVLKRPAVMKVPTFALRLALGAEAADETVLASQRVDPDVLESNGFTFVHPELETGLRQILEK